MRLNKLVLNGFKSFADRTEFTFDAPITGIVGPNGCGKSNVVDAMKWVLGEQSAKSLRGDAMMDVIFNGAASRKPSGMAEVTLHFDNPRLPDGNRLLPVDADEVAVGRRLYRDGTSEYVLNNKSSRLKDIRELFLDTGVGVDAYSLIEQGRVAQLLEANPQERRLIFEEAAGISKFKQRKKEAQRKLEKVDQNLLRVGDIVDEVERRLRGVRVQAGRARVFQEHNTKLAELRLEYALREYHTFRGELHEIETARADAAFRLDDASAELSRATVELDERKQAEQSAATARQRTEYELVELSGQLERAKQAEAFAQRQLAQLADQLAQHEHEVADGGQRLGSASQQLEQERARLAEITREVDTRQAEIARLADAFKQSQVRLHQLTQEQERAKAAVLDCMRKLTQVSNRLSSIEIERRNIATHQQRQADRRRAVVEELESLDARKSELESRAGEAAAEIAARQADIETAKRDAQQLGKHTAEVADQLSSAKEHRSGLQSRRKVLADLEQRLQGVSEGVKAVLKDRATRFPFVVGLVADVLRVDIEHAAVIEAALAGRDQWLVVTDLASALDAAGELRNLQGRVNLIAPPPLLPEPVDLPAQSEHPLRRAIDLVRFEPEHAGLAHRLLSDTVVVDSIAAARALREQMPTARFVTRAGEVLTPDGGLHTGPISGAVGLLSRRSELEQLSQQLAETERRIESLTAQLAGATEQARRLEALQSDHRSALFTANTRRVEAQSGLSQVADRANSLRRELPLLDRELQAMLNSAGKLASEEAELSERRARLDADQAANQSAADESVEQHKVLSESVRGDGEKLASARVSIAEFQQRQIAARQHEGRLGGLVAELRQKLDRLAEQRGAFDTQRQSLESELADAAHKQEVLTSRRADLSAQLESLTLRLEQSRAAVVELAGSVEAVRAGHAEIEKELNHLAIRNGELSVRIETLVTRTQDELSLDLPARYDEVRNSESGYTPAEKDWDAVAKDISDLRDRIHRLGAVNLDAIGEQDELEQRSNFLGKELNDLRDAKGQLEKLIEEINAESSDRFAKTFESVREHFQGMFRKLFGGGKADLFLETEIQPREQTITITHPDGTTTTEAAPMIKVDPLDAGIEVIARPPGKQPVSISQLSGGEKSLTCIALLLSIFKSKPSPFCVLDEVDAALDEANNQRFNLIIQEFTDRSQFIVITHSKRTMTIAEQLYGVTQQEQGVSRRVAVRFEQVGKDGRIDPAAAALAGQSETQPAPLSPAPSSPPLHARSEVHVSENSSKISASDSLISVA
jgi:chromosome segregation protein